MMVDFPEPVGPQMPMRCPTSILRFVSWSTGGLGIIIKTDLVEHDISLHFPRFYRVGFLGYDGICIQYGLDSFKGYCGLRNSTRHFGKVLYRAEEFIHVPQKNSQAAY